MMDKLLHAVSTGAIAGAVGTVTLDGATYLDMAVRGRPASNTPEKTVETLAEATGVGVPSDREKRSNRLSGLGPLMGLVTGVGVGALGGLVLRGRNLPLPLEVTLLGGGAMALTNGAMTALGVTDPRRWSPSAWAADAVPHVLYGATVAAMLRRAG